MENKLFTISHVETLDFFGIDSLINIKTKKRLNKARRAAIMNIFVASISSRVFKEFLYF
jgi:hypothetical protein